MPLLGTSSASRCCNSIRVFANLFSGTLLRQSLFHSALAIPHASSKSWGTYLLSLCFCAHSFRGIELRYCFSDKFNRRTICSNELGVLGMSSEGLPQLRLPLFCNLSTS